MAIVSERHSTVCGGGTAPSAAVGHGGRAGRSQLYVRGNQADVGPREEEAISCLEQHPRFRRIATRSKRNGRRSTGTVGTSGRRPRVLPGRQEASIDAHYSATAPAAAGAHATLTARCRWASSLPIAAKQWASTVA
jgi:hypothetical protein